MPQNEDTMKLLNEVLIFDELWQESLKTYTISLFLQDFISQVPNIENNNFIQQIIEELRGINLLNFDESQFLNSIIISYDKIFYTNSKEAIYQTIMCSKTIIKYFNAITKFFQNVIKQFYKYKDIISAENQDVIDRERKKGNIKDIKKNAQKLQKNKQNSTSETQLQENQKYWKHVIRKVLYQFMYLITPPNGLISQYLAMNAINFTNSQKNQEANSKNSNRQEEYYNMPCPVNFKLTKSILVFIKQIFEIHDKFTKYVFNEELILFYIRTHYISFIRLYNKNYQKYIKPKFTKDVSLCLCKKHLECLFAIAKNRNDDTRRKLYQFKVVSFLCQEIQLEYEVQQRREQFLKLSKDEKTKSALLQVEATNQERKGTIPQQPLQGLGLNEINLNQQPNQQTVIQQQSDIITTQQNNKQISSEIQNQAKQKGFKIPPLKVEGLGLTEITQNNQAQDIISQNQQPPQQQQQVKKGFIIPPLKVAGLGLTEINNNSQIEYLEKQEEPKKTLGFKIPPLKVAGLGLTEITSQQQNFDFPSQQIASNQPQGLENNQIIQKVIDNNNDKKIEPEINNYQNQQDLKANQSKIVKKFNIPNLNVKGLGFTDLVSDPPILIQQEKSPNEQNIEQKIIDQKIEVKKKPFIPGLKVAGLGFADIVPDKEDQTLKPSILINQNQTITQVDEEEEKLFERKTQQFEKTAPINLYQNNSFLNPPSINNDDQQLLSQDSAQFLQKSKHVQIIPQELMDQHKKEKLQQTRKNLIPPRARNSSLSKRSNENEENNILFDKQEQKYSNAKGEGNHRISLQSVISPNTLLKVESVVEQQSTPKNQSQQFLQLQAPSSFCQTPNNESMRSSGSYIGKNKVFIPFLKFPDNIHEDPSEKIIIYQKPDDNRYRLIKTKESHGVTPERQDQITGMSRISGATSNNSKSKGGIGKRGKLLDLSAQKQTQNKLSFNFQKSRSDEEQKLIGDDQSEDKKQVQQQQQAEEIIINYQVKEVIKKPFIPSIKIPEKQDQPEGKEKIKQQLEMQEKYNNNDNNNGNLTKLEMSLNQMNAKFQLVKEKNKENGKDSPLKRSDLCDLSEEEFYLKERLCRPIYQDEELHVLMISLIISLLLKPQRGTLDDLYCSQYPVDNGKQNVLFLLHYHLNNKHNQGIVPKLQKRIHQTSSPLAGQRLLKLLCASLFDLSLYSYGKGWKKLGEGAYATVWECQLNLIEPQSVAIKQMMVPNTIYKRCVLHDIFTEITCLEELRLEPSVTDLYDYGVDGICYYIIMKRYSSSLREWRLQQTKPFSENLSLYLSIYKEVLKAIEKIHSHNVTHYDIKCDNVLIDLGDKQINNALAQWYRPGDDEEKIRITLGDFGECKMFTNEKDEFCLRNRGTDYIKSPEMLELAVNSRKDTDKYDRRKQVGTNRLSDVWSLGCLFFELLTGEFLFQSQDYIAFYMRVTKPNEQLLTNEKLDLISNNVYLIDFLKYMLIRDPKLRPPIQSVLKRFEHVHALLVSTSSATYRFSAIQNQKQTSLDVLIDQAEQMIEDEQNESTMLQKNDEDQQYQKEEIIIQLICDVFYCTNKWIKQNQKKAIKLGITHVILESQNLTHSVKDKFDILEIDDYIFYKNQIQKKMNPFILMPIVMDYLRKVALHNGKVIFVEGQAFIKESLLICLTQIFQTNAYETFTLIRSQNLHYNITADRLANISKWSLITSKIKRYVDTYPKFQCYCGSCVITLQRQYANYSNLQIINCNCCQYYKNIETSQCPSPGCNEFIQFIKQYFKMPYEYLQWGFLEQNLQDEKLFFLTQGLEKNSQLVSIIEKKSIGGNQSKDIMSQDYNLISKSSATAKNYYYPGYSRWKLYKCKVCHTWTHAINDVENINAILLNNRVKNDSEQRGILNNQSNNQTGVRVPVLEKIQLKVPF